MRYHSRENEEALPARVARLSDDMLEFAEDPRPVMILDSNGNPLKTEIRTVSSKQHGYTNTTGNIIFLLNRHVPYALLCHRRQPLRTVHLHGGNTHTCNRLDDPSLDMPIQRQMVSLFHDSAPSGGVSYLRSMKVCELEYNPDGTIRTISGETRRHDNNLSRRQERVINLFLFLPEKRTFHGVK